MQSITIPSYDLQTVSCDVCVVGGGTGGVVAALAAARQGAKTVLIEAKGYVGGTLVEGGTALHSFFNNYAVFWPGRACNWSKGFRNRSSTACCLRRQLRACAAGRALSAQPGFRLHQR